MPNAISTARFLQGFSTLIFKYHSASFFDVIHEICARVRLGACHTSVAEQTWSVTAQDVKKHASTQDVTTIQWQKT
jgi:hypothetical protein